MTNYPPLNFLQQSPWDKTMEFLSQLSVVFIYKYIMKDTKRRDLYDELQNTIRQEIQTATPADILSLLNRPLLKDYDKSDIDNRFPYLHQILSAKLEPELGKFYPHSNITQQHVYHNLFTNASAHVWATYKQVYCFDTDFFKELTKTESLNIYPTLLQRLPYPTFYIETTDILPDCHGVMISVDQQSDFKLNLMFHYFLYHPEKRFEVQGYHINLRPDMLQYDKQIPYYEYDSERLQKHLQTSNQTLHTATMFCLQAMTYLCSKQPDIIENPEQQRIYKKPTKVRNKYSEIRKWDVGIRIGTAFRQQRKQNQSVSNGHTGSKKRPHVRRAHWHRYRTGKGRMNLELRWIEPVFIGNPKDNVATKHAVKPQK